MFLFFQKLFYDSTIGTIVLHYDEFGFCLWGLTGVTGDGHLFHAHPRMSSLFSYLYPPAGNVLLNGPVK